MCFPTATNNEKFQGKMVNMRLRFNVHGNIFLQRSILNKQAAQLRIGIRNMGIIKTLTVMEEERIMRRGTIFELKLSYKKIIFYFLTFLLKLFAE